MVASARRYTSHAGLRNNTLYAMVVALCAAVMSCTEPADTGAGRFRVRVDVDWSGCGNDAPPGMTVLFHHSSDGETTQAITNDVSHAVHRLPEGRHWATVFNLTADEFAGIGFRGLESVETAEAYARRHSGSKWYAPRPDAGGYVADTPEWLAADTVLTAPVTPTPGEDPQSAPATIGTLRPRSLTHTLHLTIHTGNIGSLLSARGAIGGLAAGCRLASGSPADNRVTATHIIESGSWICLRPSSTSGHGMVKADIRCFGLPSGHRGTPGENRLEFQALLADGTTVERYDIPVGHLIGRSGNDSDLYLELWLDPGLPPCSGSGGIDVWFDDWDEYVDFNIPL